MNHILCPDCFARGVASGVIREEKSCSHGCGAATCVECGRTRAMDDRPYWHCLGSIEPVQPSSAATKPEEPT